MRNFRNLEIWQQGIQLVMEIYKLCVLLPKEEKFGLISQICRAAVSIPSNIAEGSSRNSETEYKRFLEIALGSAFEVETQLQIIYQLKMTTTENFELIFKLLLKEEKMINSLITKLAR